MELLKFEKPVEPTHTEQQKEFVAEAIAKAQEVGFEEIIIIGTEGDYIHYLHSQLGEQRMVYLAEKFKHFVLNGGMDE